MSIDLYVILWGFYSKVVLLYDSHYYTFVKKIVIFLRSFVERKSIFNIQFFTTIQRELKEKKGKSLQFSHYLHCSWSIAF